MKDCCDRFKELIARVRPSITKAIEVTSQMLTKKLDEELANSDLGEDIKAVIKDTAGAFIKEGTKMTKEELDQFAETHVKNSIKLTSLKAVDKQVKKIQDGIVLQNKEIIQEESSDNSSAHPPMKTTYLSTQNEIALKNNIVIPEEEINDVSSHHSMGVTLGGEQPINAVVTEIYLAGEIAHNATVTEESIN